jgi:hypothetical protein
MARLFDLIGCRLGFEVDQPARSGRPEKPRPTELSPLVKRMDVVGCGVFANNHFAFLAATLRMNRKRHMIPVDLDQESPQFEIIAQSFVPAGGKPARPWRHPLCINV